MLIKKKLYAFLVMAVFMGSTMANDIYIEQIGDTSTINITQDGTGNTIGDSAIPAFIGGGSNTVAIDQVGIGNTLSLLVNGASAATTVNTLGNNNTQSITCGSSASASCSGSVIKQLITGDDNTVTQNLGGGANHTSEIASIGDSNTVTHTSTTSGVSNVNIAVTGGTTAQPNIISVNQSGTTAQSVTVNSSGNGNNIAIIQSN